MLTLALVTGGNSAGRASVLDGDDGATGRAQAEERTEKRAGDQALQLCLHQLQGALQRGLKLVIVDLGDDPRRLDQLEGFVAGPGRGARLLRLAQPDLGRMAALQLAQAETGEGYVLGLGPADLLRLEALPGVLQILEDARPDLMICGNGWWLSGPDAPLPPPDQSELHRAQAGLTDPGPSGPDHGARLYPDPRRLLFSRTELARLAALPQGRDLSNGRDLAPGPRADWQLWDQAVPGLGQAGPGGSGAQGCRVFAEALLLHPLPQGRLAQAFEAGGQVLAAQPRHARAACLQQLALRLAQEMALCDPETALQDAQAAARFYQRLGRSARAALVQERSALGLLMRALKSGGEMLALGVLAQQAACKDRQHLLALAGETRALRADLSLALPGPDYLRSLYEKIRGW